MTSVIWTRVGRPSMARKIAACFDGSLYALNADKSLWVNRRSGMDAGWENVRDLPSDTVNIACAAGLVYFQKEDRSLWYISRNDELLSAGRPWAAADIAGTEDNSLDFPFLWALNDDKTLWRNGAGGADGQWQQVGQPQGAAKIAATQDLLFALNTDGSFWINRDGGRDDAWEHVVSASDAIEITAASIGQSSLTHLYALDDEHSLSRGIISPVAARAWTPDNRPVAVVRGFNGSEDHQWGLAPNWAAGGVSWLIGEMRRLHDKGYRRFMIHVPAGKSPEDIFPSAQWNVLDSAGIETSSGSVRQDFVNRLTPWLANNPHIKVLVYLGFRIDSPYDRDMSNAHAPNMTLESDREVVRANLAGFIDLAPDKCVSQIGFRFDNSGTPWHRAELVALADWYGDRQVSIGGEAIPTIKSEFQGEPEYDIPVLVDRCPWVANYRGHRRRDPKRLWRFNPNTTEVGIELHGRVYMNRDVSPEFRIENEDDMAQVVSEFRERGCVFYVFAREWDDIVLETWQAERN